jgi:hypothetical protein
VAALQVRIPPWVVLSVYLLALAAMFLVGAQSGYAESRNLVALVLMVLALSAVLYLIVDLDRAQAGLLQVSPAGAGRPAAEPAGLPLSRGTRKRGHRHEQRPSRSPLLQRDAALELAAELLGVDRAADGDDPRARRTLAPLPQVLDLDAPAHREICWRRRPESNR